MYTLYDIYNSLFETYGPQGWWPAESVFEMITGAILVQNTSWSNVERALLNFGGRLSPQFILSCPMDELCDIIRPSGFYNLKAERLKNVSRWYQRYDCHPETVLREEPGRIREELLDLGGIGYETADSIMLYAFDKPYFVVDTYTRRLLERLGFDLPDNYEEIRQYCENRLPYRSALFNEFHALIVRHAKENCKKRPACEGCVLKNDCTVPLSLDKTAMML